MLESKFWSYVLGSISSSSSLSVIVDCLCNLGFLDRNEELDELLTWSCSLFCISAAADGCRNCSIGSVVSAGSGVLVGGLGSSKNQYKILVSVKTLQDLY